MKFWCSRLIRPLTLAVLVAAPIPLLTADETETAATAAAAHPLAWTLKYASSNSDYIHQNVHDYSCRLIKRERIDGKLQSPQFARVKVRCEQKQDGEVVKPMAVFIQFLAPAKIKDRRILYIDGQNNGEMLVRKGGISMKYLKLRLKPGSTQALRESKYPITEIGFDKIFDRLIQLAKDDMASDPTAANTQVSHFRDAKVNDRVCSHLRVVHPAQGKGIMFHEANLFVDNELKVPIRLVVHGWPESEGGEKPLIEEYSYVDLKMNVGLKDADFSEESLGSSPSSSRPETKTSASLSR
jgi:hypothetical protein